MNKEEHNFVWEMAQYAKFTVKCINSKRIESFEAGVRCTKGFKAKK